MSELIILCSVLILVVLVAVLGPFFSGTGGLLQDASVSDGLDELELRRSALLKRWLKDEAAFKSGDITKTEWSQRRSYLTARYVDVSRRIAWLKSVSVHGEAQR